MNISVTLLSKSTFTVVSSCISAFSTPIFNHTSLNILNILLISLYLFFSFTVLFRTLVHILLYCAFSSIGYTATLQFQHSFFFPVLYSGHRILLLSCSNTLSLIAFFLLHFIYCTLIISSLLASFSLQFHAS